MRDCYKKFWKIVLVEQMSAALPEFRLKETPSRAAADSLKPSQKPLKFVWVPVDKLSFLLKFCVPGRQDGFEGDCGWSEKGALTGIPWRHDSSLTDSFFESPMLLMRLVNISAVEGDTPIIGDWRFWRPTTSIPDAPSLGEQTEAYGISFKASYDAYMAEFIAEEMRDVPDWQAREHVEIAVRQAVMDVKRRAMPWFERKLDWYVKNKRL